VRKWRDRFLTEGEAGLEDRSSRPHRSPNRTQFRFRQRVLRLRRQHRWGADHIAHETGLAASTVQAILNAEGVGRLNRGDRASEPVLRYQFDEPGGMIHVDVKKISGIPVGGGWRIHGRGNDNYKRFQQAGYRYIHSAIDDRTRLVYSEIHSDEQAATAGAFWARASTWFATWEIRCHRVLTDNGSCYKSGLWHRACAATDTKVKKTRPRRPQTNGKIEGFHRILLEEWAYIRPWHSDRQRQLGYDRFLHFYNHHRAHGALGWSTPAATLHALRDNVPAVHI
jgi:transposase InsO family protein